MLNNFIYAQTKDLFLEALNAGNILDEAIVFIEDTKEIWNHGHYFAGESIDPNAFAKIQTEVAAITAGKLDKSEAESTYATKEELEELEEIKWLVLEEPLIQFSIDGVTYWAAEETTWEKWINSSLYDSSLNLSWNEFGQMYKGSLKLISSGREYKHYTIKEFAYWSTSLSPDQERPD